MMILSVAVALLGLQAAFASSHITHTQHHKLYKGVAATEPEQTYSEAELEMLWGEDWAFSGIATFGHLDHWKCLTKPNQRFDIAIIGAPFDTAVSYRSGARMGPRAIRQASNRHIVSRGYNRHVGLNPYTDWARVVDCGDIPITPFDNAVALPQMTRGFMELNKRKTTVPHSEKSGNFPKFITLGGDHLVALPALRALRQSLGQPAVLLHFDSHLDSLHPNAYPSTWTSEVSDFNHGTVFYNAMIEGLITNDTSMHVGINTRMTGNNLGDYLLDDQQGFLRIPADAVDEIGMDGVANMISKKIPTDAPVYVSIDIDVLDPGFAPGTGAPEPGGWTTRELMGILRRLHDLNIVGADIVEVAPQYDTPGGETAFVAANLAYELISGMVKREVPHRKISESVPPTAEVVVERHVADKLNESSPPLIYTLMDHVRQFMVMPTQVRKMSNGMRLTAMGNKV